MPGGATGARARRCYTISLLMSQASRSPSAQQSDVGRRTRHSLSEAEPPWAVAGSETGPSASYNLRLRRKRSNPEFEDVHLAAMTIDPIDEAADDLIVEDDSDS